MIRILDEKAPAYEGIRYDPCRLRVLVDRKRIRRIPEIRVSGGTCHNSAHESDVSWVSTKYDVSCDGNDYNPPSYIRYRSELRAKLQDGYV